MRFLLRFTISICRFLFCFITTFVVTAEHRCGFDRIASKVGPLSRAVVRELPHKGRAGVLLQTAFVPGWKPIRFGFSMKDLEDTSKHCTAVGENRTTFLGTRLFCTENDILTDSKKRIIVDFLLPRAAQMHADRLLVRPMLGKIFVPRFTQSICSEYTVPPEHTLYGVSNVDMLLYISAGPSDDNSRAWAAPCYAVLGGRPIVGVVNFVPKYIAASEFNVRVAAHEIAHALGFTVGMMLERDMLSVKSGVRGKKAVLLVDSPKTREKTRAHYNCSSALGMELEDSGGAGTSASHWERRNAKDELMAGISGVGYYTSLTMAAFEDMGFYKARWGAEETMGWGKNAGCSLLKEKCVTNGKPVNPEMFCTTESDLLSCTSDRRALGSCVLVNYNAVLPHNYRYFGQSNRAGPSNSLTDLCPVIERKNTTSCADGVQNIMRGSLLGETSRCLRGVGLRDSNGLIGDVCVDVHCNNGSVSVRYLGDNSWHNCSAGSSINPKGIFTAGTLLCPKYSDVCFEKASDIRNERVNVGNGGKPKINADSSSNVDDEVNNKRQEGSQLVNASNVNGEDKPVTLETKGFEGSSNNPKEVFTAGTMLCPNFSNVCFEKANDTRNERVNVGNGGKPKINADSSSNVDDEVNNKRQEGSQLVNASNVNGEGKPVTLKAANKTSGFNDNHTLDSCENIVKFCITKRTFVVFIVYALVYVLLGL